MYYSMHILYIHMRTEIFASNENASQKREERYSILFLDESKIYVAFNG